MTVNTSRFGAWLRGVDAFAAKLQLLQRAPEAIDVCEAQAAETALFGDDPDDDEDEQDEQDEQEGEPAPAASAGRDCAPAHDADLRASTTA